MHSEVTVMSEEILQNDNWKTSRNKKCSDSKNVSHRVSDAFKVMAEACCM